MVMSGAYDFMRIKGAFELTNIDSGGNEYAILLIEDVLPVISQYGLDKLGI